MLRIGPHEQALFVSDMHLSQAQPATAAWFLAQLDEAALGAQHVFLLGDLFDAWVGDDLLADPACDPVVAAFVDWLRAAHRRGVGLYLQHGNRDFLIGSAFEALTGAALLPDPCRIKLHGTPVLLSHGDALCTDDTTYQQLRRELRAPAWRDQFLARPLADRLAAARQMRAQSEQAKRGLQADLMDVNAQAVLDLLRAQQVRVLIHGHTHRPAHHRLDLDGRAAHRWVLPDWQAEDSRGGFLRALEGMLQPMGAWPAPAPAACPVNPDA